MASMNESDLILKQDAGGRVFVPAGRQIELVQEFERSGLSAPKFAAMAGVKYQTFVTWRRKHGTAAPVRRCSPERGAFAGGYCGMGARARRAWGCVAGKVFPLHGSRVSGTCLNG
jgi:hypothetical protein